MVQEGHRRERLSLAPSTTDEKVVLLGIFLFITALFIVGARLSPKEEGYGTHTQLGLWPCAFRETFGTPCPMCGVTTSFAWASRLKWKRALLVQPIGLFAFVLAAGAWVLGGFALLSGSSAAHMLSKTGTWRKLWIVPALVLVVGSWVYKIALELKG